MIMLDAVTVRSGGFELRDVGFVVPTGAYGVLMGRTGSGKSTLLEAICGLRPVAAGSIRLGDRDVTRLPAAARDIGYVPQDRALFSHMTVGRQIALPLEVRRWPRATIHPRVAEVAALLGIEPLLARHPAGLSGGEAQRVALARALVFRPEVLLLDEPLAALDKKLREQTQFELTNLQYQLGTSFVVVTHDQEEAMTLASRIAVMDKGKFLQVGAPQEIYEFPCSRFVAEFVGTANVFAGRVESTSERATEVRVDGVDSALLGASLSSITAGDSVWLAVRPEKIQLSKLAPDAQHGRCVLAGVVQDLAYYGGRSVYRVRLGGGQTVLVSAQNRSRSPVRNLEWDESVFLYWDASAGVVLGQ